MKKQKKEQTYKEFLKSKRIKDDPTGFKVKSLPSFLYPFQEAITRWALARGRAAIFADCGLGKTPIQLAWASKIPGNVLILAPLAVSTQTQKEGKKFGIEVNLASCQEDIKPGINITNYEKLHKFNVKNFTGVVLDESSILKSYTGHFRNTIIKSFANTKYKLACTATPAPNDYMELGNHAEFIGAMTRTEMLACFFIHDGSSTQNWRLKGHADGPFWEWLTEWAVMLKDPSDIGFEDDRFTLPELKIHNHTVKCKMSFDENSLIPEVNTLKERRKARWESLPQRIEKAKEIITEKDSWVIWCNLNKESSESAKAIPDAKEITGSDKNEYKSETMLGFKKNNPRVLVTKPKISGFGMNWQHCNHVMFMGLSDSYEQFYQAVRRCWRFGQTKPVHVHIIISEAERNVLNNIKRKEKDAKRMRHEMLKNMKSVGNLKKTKRKRMKYEKKTIKKEKWTAMLGDSVERIKEIESDSIGFTIFSPPFSSLYTYTNSERDMGNCSSHDEFYQHFSEYLIPELYRITMPGRLLAFHCSNLTLSKERDGYIGLTDFRGELIKRFIDHGWIYHSEVCIWKDPLLAAVRTKALGLLHKQLCKDSSKSRQGLADYLVVMRKPGENPDPIDHPNGLNEKEMDQLKNKGSHKFWQKLASPVWFDIDQTNTLSHRTAREQKDERHICPLQLEVIERALTLWSKPNDIVFSPFMGIGSEGYVSIQEGRKFIGIELKKSYYKQALKNLKKAENKKNIPSLFERIGE